MSGTKRRRDEKRGPNRILIVVTVVVIALLALSPLIGVLAGGGTPR